MMSDTKSQVAILRRATLIFVPLAAVALMITYLLYNSQAAAVRAGAVAIERRMTEAAQQRVIQTLMIVLSDAMYLANQDALQTWLTRNDTDAYTHLRNEHLAFIRSRAIYDQVRLLDQAGREVLRVDWANGTPQVAEQGASTAEVDPIAAQILKLDRGQLLMSEFYGGARRKDSRSAIFAVVPVFDAAGLKQGTIILKYQSLRLLNRLESLSNESTGLWFVDHAGAWLNGPQTAAQDDDVHDPNQESGDEPSFAASHPAMWSQIQAGGEAAVFTDPDGRFTFARITAQEYRPLAATQMAGATVAGPAWYAIAHTPAVIVWRQTAELRRYIFFATSVLLLLLATTSYVLARHQLRRGDAERRTRLSEARFRDLLESAPDGIIILDAAGRIDLVNVQVERQFGYPRHELVGKSIEKLLPGQLRTLTAPASQHDATESGLPKPGADLHGTRKDGSAFPISISFSPTRMDNGFGLFCDIRDVSAQRATERRIQELNRRLLQDNAELEGLNRELETFSYSVSHDLRAPLRAITGFSQALQEDSGDRLNPDGRSHLERLRHAAQRMEILIDDLLALAKVSRSEISKTSVNVSDLAREILGELAAGDPRHHARAEIAPGLRASADPRLLRIALENLLNNAWKFTRPSQPAAIAPAAITVGQEMTAAGPAFFVRDNGVGFDMTKAAGLFRPFDRLHEGRQFPGTGVGLATAQRVILRHGGQIWARSRPGEGAIFYFTLQ